MVIKKRLQPVTIEWLDQPTDAATKYFLTLAQSRGGNRFVAPSLINNHFHTLCRL